MLAILLAKQSAWLLCLSLRATIFEEEGRVEGGRAKAKQSNLASEERAAKHKQGGEALRGCLADQPYARRLVPGRQLSLVLLCLASCMYCVSQPMQAGWMSERITGNLRATGQRDIGETELSTRKAHCPSS